MTVRDLTANGMTPDDARREAERRFGDVERTRARLATIDRSRAERERRAEWWSAFAQDLRYALRGLRLKPGSRSPSSLTLGLGIGANATMFGIVDRLLFRPPAYLIAPERSASALLRAHHRRKGVRRERIAVPALSSIFATSTRRWSVVAAYSRTPRARSASARRRVRVRDRRAEREHVAAVRRAARSSAASSPPTKIATPNGTRVVVLVYGYWQTQYAGVARRPRDSASSIGPPSTRSSASRRVDFTAAADARRRSCSFRSRASAVDGFGATWARYRKTYNMHVARRCTGGESRASPIDAADGRSHRRISAELARADRGATDDARARASRSRASSVGSVLDAARAERSRRIRRSRRGCSACRRSCCSSRARTSATCCWRARSIAGARSRCASRSASAARGSSRSC